LISFSLRLLDALRPDYAALAHGSALHIELLAEIMRVTNLARRELEAQELEPRQQSARLLGAATVARWTRVLHDLLALPVTQRALDAIAPAPPNTTQISVIDEDGLAVSLTTSGGEGPGFVVPGVGLILNNMLGEADLHPQGFHRSPVGQRIPSMMAPTVVLQDGWPTLVTGSGGANRIRSAILQVLVNALACGLPLDEAVEASRIHFEEGVLHLEGGVDPAAADQLAAIGYRVNRWADRHMFFGGAHSAARTASGQFQAVGDPRRGGSAVVWT
jgi:gamma-glutamyltranspeptidase/glutathione hydrolase